VKGIIAYYSTTGNTALLCRAIKMKIPSIDFQLHDMTKDGGFDPLAYDLVGFATFADEMRIPELMDRFIVASRVSKPVYAFVFNTFGSISGRTLDDLVRAADLAGYRVIAADSFHMPENFPPIIKTGLSFKGQPDDRQAKRLNRFIGRIETIRFRIEAGEEVRGIRRSRMLSRFPLPPRFLARTLLGAIEFDLEKCTRCMRCVKGCPSQAIRFSDGFVVDRAACRSCWKCYNLCPTNAVHGTKFKNGFQYRPDAAALLGRLDKPAR
jgi:ferredoxin